MFLFMYSRGLYAPRSIRFPLNWYAISVSGDAMCLPHWVGNMLWWCLVPMRLIF